MLRMYLGCNFKPRYKNCMCWIMNLVIYYNLNTVLRHKNHRNFIVGLYYNNFLSVTENYNHWYFRDTL
jgi:hypothetical protein